MAKHELTYAQVVRDRDEAIAERDFILEFVQELGDGACRPTPWASQPGCAVCAP